MARTNAEPPTITGDVYRVSIYTSSQSQTCINSWDYMGSALPTTVGGDMVAFLNAWWLNVGTQYAACLTGSTRIPYALCQCISSLKPPTIQKATNGAGTVAGSPLPIEMAAILKKLSGLKGQHGRGRVFMPSIPISFTTPTGDPNLLNATGTLAYTSLAVNLLTPQVIAGTSYVPVISKRPVGPVNVVTQAAVVVDMQPVALLATQRRRKEGRGI